MRRVESAAAHASDESLRALLDFEQQLQARVRAAKDDAVRRIAEARAASGRRLAEARAVVEQADAERARADRIAHEQALARIAAAHQHALAVIAEADARTDDLARWALADAIAGAGDAQ